MLRLSRTPAPSLAATGVTTSRRSRSVMGAPDGAGCIAVFPRSATWSGRRPSGSAAAARAASNAPDERPRWDAGPDPGDRAKAVTGEGAGAERPALPSPDAACEERARPPVGPGRPPVALGPLGGGGARGRAGRARRRAGRGRGGAGWGGRPG